MTNYILFKSSEFTVSIYSIMELDISEIAIFYLAAIYIAT